MMSETKLEFVTTWLVCLYTTSSVVDHWEVKCHDHKTDKYSSASSCTLHFAIYPQLKAEELAHHQK